MYFESKDGCRIPGYPMKVRQLIARLQLADPDAMILLDTASHALVVVSNKIGQRPEPVTEPEFSEDDLKFLRQLRIC